MSVVWNKMLGKGAEEEVNDKIPMNKTTYTECLVTFGKGTGVNIE
jgi:hypothetical protein